MGPGKPTRPVLPRVGGRGRLGPLPPSPPPRLAPLGLSQQIWHQGVFAADGALMLGRGARASPQRAGVRGLLEGWGRTGPEAPLLSGLRGSPQAHDTNRHFRSIYLMSGPGAAPLRDNEAIRYSSVSCSRYLASLGGSH